MSPEERIARLEALLARVRSRSRAAPPPLSLNGKGENGGAHPRDEREPLAARFPSEPPSSPRHPSATPPRPPAPPTVAPTDVSLDRTLAEAAITSPRRPPPETSQIRVIDSPRAEPPPMEVVELEIDPDTSLPPAPASGEDLFESRSRLVSAPPAFEPLDEEPIAPPPASEPTIEVGAVEVAPADLAAFEDETPSSSRRPISIEEKMAEEDDALPLHAAPPKSGPLPAAEPAIELGFEVPTGVRRYDVVEPAARPRSEPPMVVRPEPSSDARVGAFVGRAPTGLAAATFGELLDQSLDLLRD